MELLRQMRHILKSQFCLGSKKNLQEISSNIFSSLRKIDKLDGCELAIIEGLEKRNLGLSIMNRLARACENNII